MILCVIEYMMIKDLTNLGDLLGLCILNKDLALHETTYIYQIVSESVITTCTNIITGPGHLYYHSLLK